MRSVLFHSNFIDLKSKCVQYSSILQKADFEKFASEDCIKKCVQKMSTLKLVPDGKKMESRASVLIPLCHTNNDLCLLYTLRTHSLRRHPGKISFPGGMCDENENPEDTASRETEEEVGFLRNKIKIYGCGAPILRSGVSITPTVGYLGHVGTNDFKINKEEVQFAFTVPLSMLCDPECCRYTQFRNSYTLPVYVIDGFRIWGVTGFLTHLFLKCLADDLYKLKLVQSTRVLKDL